MNYYYDIFLNFNEENVMFYEWLDSDILEYYKKIPVFQVSSKALKDIVNNNIRVQEEFLKKILNKAQRKNKVNKYAAIIADKNGAIAVEFNDEGLSIARSYLKVEDELNLMNMLYTMSVEKIDYEIMNPMKVNSNLRMEDKIKLLINTEVNSLINNKDYSKLKYLYMEWFNKTPCNDEEMIKTLKEGLGNKIGNNELKIYNLIKLSYNWV